MTIDNPLRIGAVVREALLSNELIAGRVNGRIYPYTTQNEVKMPCIVYDGISVDYEEYKDGAYATEVTMSLNVNATDYPGSIELAEEVIDVLSEHEGVVPVSVSCEYDNAALIYVHNITIKVYL